jgi:hypothetical protein
VADADDNILIQITYGTAAPWPAATDGNGPSLELIDLSGDRSAPDRWQSSAANGGSPGLPVSVEPASVSGLVREGNQLRLSIAAQAGRTYHIFTTKSLDGNVVWRHERAAAAPASEGLIEILFEMPADIPMRFFKTVVALP